jgi:hypothetical protein
MAAQGLPLTQLLWAAALCPRLANPLEVGSLELASSETEKEKETERKGALSRRGQETKCKQKTSLM